jgi:hypothetical protein
MLVIKYLACLPGRCAARAYAVHAFVRCACAVLYVCVGLWRACVVRACTVHACAVHACAVRAWVACVCYAYALPEVCRYLLGKQTTYLLVFVHIIFYDVCVCVFGSRCLSSVFPCLLLV